jgi:hypothetical protein
MMCAVAPTYDVSAEALRPLMQTYWSAEGWRRPPVLPEQVVLDSAIAAGVMFPGPRRLGHDAWVDLARTVAARVTRDEVADAFLASLGSRRLDLRSALASYALARVLPVHTYEPSGSGGSCGVCGQYGGDRPEDLNVLNFERFKWGGVRRVQVPYVAFDLEQFLRAPRLIPTSEDVALGRRLIAATRGAAPDTTAARLAADLGFLKGNRAEREIALDVLSVCGILETDVHRGYFEGFVPATRREDPPKRFVERVYPLSWWTGADGINDQALEWFLPAMRP